MNTKNTELCHHGILGQKWGIRRYQNEDGSYKNGATGRYNNEESGQSGKFKKVAKIGAVVVGSALAAYGAYKLSKHLSNRSGLEKEREITKNAVNTIKALSVRPIPNPSSNTKGFKPNLKIGGEHPEFTEEDMDKLLRNAEKLKKAASDSSKRTIDIGEDLVNDLLKKNGKSLGL